MKLLIAFLVTTAFAQSYSPVIQGQLALCQSYERDWNRAGECYNEIAVRQKDASICDRIQWNGMRMGCKRRIIYEQQMTPVVLFPKLPWLIFAVSLALFLWRYPPRKPYLTGGIVGAGVALSLLAINYPAHPSLAVLQPYVRYIASPIDGVMAYSPYIIQDLPFDLRFLLTHVLLYAVVLGLFLQGEKEKRKLACAFLVFAVLVTFWSHPIFDSVRELASAYL